MKTSHGCAMLALAISLLMMHVAAQTAAETPLRIGFIDSTEVLYETEEGRNGLEELNRFMGGKQQEIQNESNELQKRQEQFATQQATLNPDARNELRREIEELDRRLKRLQEDAQVEFNRRQGELLERIGSNVERIIEEYAQENGFGVILLRDERQAYVDPSLDITEEIVRIYNQKHPATGAPGGR